MNRLITRDDFPCRPRRNDSESLVGYLYRLLSTNGHYMATSGYYNAVRRLYAGDPVHTKEILGELSAVIGEPSYQDDRFWEERSLLPRSNPGQRAFSFPNMRSNSLWLCPACMRENAFHREYWVMPLAKTCPVHGSWLTDCCGICDAGLFWDSLESGWRCSSGHIIYDVQPTPTPTPATYPSIPRDRLMALHGHFVLKGKGASKLDRYRRDAPIHEMNLAYYWVVLPKRLGAQWGLVWTPAQTANSKPDRLTVACLEQALGCSPPLTYAFVRWAYLWRITMAPLGRHVPVPIPVLKYVVRRRPVSTDAVRGATPSRKGKGGGKRRFGVAELLYEQRVFQLRHILVYRNVQIPQSVGLSMQHHFDRWWPGAIADARQHGFIRSVGGSAARQRNRRRRKSMARHTKIEIVLTTLLDHLFFSACMLFSAVDLTRFWSGLVLPRTLPGSSRTPVHRRIAAYLMTRSLAELEHWNSLIEADLAQRHREFCDELT